MAEWALWYCNHHVPIGERGWNYFLFIYIVMVFPLCGRLNVCTESQVIQTMACVSNTERFSGSSVDVVSWNVKSINHPVKIKKVITDLKQLRADIQLSRRPRYVRKYSSPVIGTEEEGLLMISNNIQFSVWCTGRFS